MSAAELKEEVSRLSKGRRRRGAVSERRATQRTPSPLKQVVVLADAAGDLEAVRDFYAAQEPGVELLAVIRS